MMEKQPPAIEPVEEIKIIRYLNMGIFAGAVLLSVGFSYDELIPRIQKGGWAKALMNDKMLIDSGNNFALARHMTNTKTGLEVKYFYIILTKMFQFSDREMCVLAHEVLHICQFYLKDVLDMDREYECVAYTHTHLMEQCLKNMRGAYKKTDGHP